MFIFKNDIYIENNDINHRYTLSMVIIAENINFLQITLRKFSHTYQTIKERLQYINAVFKHIED